MPYDQEWDAERSPRHIHIKISTQRSSQRICTTFCTRKRLRIESSTEIYKKIQYSESLRHRYVSKTWLISNLKVKQIKSKIAAETKKWKKKEIMKKRKKIYIKNSIPKTKQKRPPPKKQAKQKPTTALQEAQEPSSPDRRRKINKKNAVSWLTPKKK